MHFALVNNSSVNRKRPLRKNIAIIFYLIITVVPIVAGLTYSILYSVGLAGLLGKGFTLRHWAILLSEAETWRSLIYTSLITIISLILSIIPAMAIAYWMHFKRKSNSLYRSLFLPLSLPPLIAGFAIYQLLSPSGFLSRIAFHLGLISSIDDFPRLVNDAASFGLVTTHVVLLFPFFSLVFFNLSKKENMMGLRQISMTLGASDGHFLRKVWIPIILKRAASLLLLYAVFLFGTYEVPLLLGRSAPRVVTIFIVEKVSKYDLSGIPVGHAMVVLYAGIVGILATIMILRKKRRKFE